jgi:hypothetical protein
VNVVVPNQTSSAAHPGAGVHLYRVAIVLWVGLTAFCTIRSYVQPGKHSVYPIYMHAAKDWSAGHDVYAYIPGEDVFRYGPTAAAFLSLLQPLGDALGGALWRLLGMALVAFGMNAFLRDALPIQLSRLERSLAFILVWPLLLQNANNGQANVHLLGLLLWSVADVAQGRLWRAACLLAISCMIKPYVLALAGLLVLIEPRLSWRLVVTLSAALALPFATQSPTYVLQQYRSWLHHLALGDRTSASLELVYRDVQLLFRVAQWPISHLAYQAIEVVAGLIFAGIVVYGRYLHQARRELLTVAFALGGAWMTVFGPATEACTYLLLAPATAAILLLDGSIWSRVVVGLLIATCAAALFPDDWRVQALGVQPIAGLLLIGVLARRCGKWHNRCSFPTEFRVAA